MRPSPPLHLQQSVRDFLVSIDVLPNWIDSSASEKPGRGHYEWGNWSDALRAVHFWTLGGPWRALVIDVKNAALINTVADFHKIKDLIVWEVVEQTYLRAEVARNSSASDETRKTRIRSVFSWQRRHDVKKNSIMWFLDFAFVLAAYSEFQGRMLFSSSHISTSDPENIIPNLSPAEFGLHAHSLEHQMISHDFLPFYARVSLLQDHQVLITRRLAATFCHDLPPPTVDMDGEVQGTRGMPREEKAVDFMTPWLQTLQVPHHQHRWNHLTQQIVNYSHTLSNFDAFLTELSRCIVYTTLLIIAISDAPEAGYVYDIAATTALEHSEQELLVSLRLPGQKRKRTVSRRTFRSDLNQKLQSIGFSNTSTHQSPPPIISTASFPTAPASTPNTTISPSTTAISTSTTHHIGSSSSTFQEHNPFL